MRWKGVMWLAVSALLAAVPLGAVDFVQNNWLGGAVAGSSTSLPASWPAFDWQSGGIVVRSTGLASRQDNPGSWVQTDDGTGDSGFRRAGSLFSTTTVSGTGASASVMVSTAEAVSPRASSLAGGHGDISAVYFPADRQTFLFGGTRDDGSASNVILRYDAQADALVDTGKTLLMPRSEMGAAYYPGQGGLAVLVAGSSGNILSSQIQYFQSGWPWPSLAGRSLPQPRTQVAAVYHPGTGKVYIFGGKDVSPAYYDDISAYTPPPSENLVLQSTALPSGRSAAAAVYYPPNGNIYLFGGTGAGGDLDEIVAYDPLQDSRTVMGAALPTPRRKVAAVYHPGTRRILLFGGISGGTPVSDILEYDVDMDSVIVRPLSLPSAGGGSAAALDGSTGRFCVFGATVGAPAALHQVTEYTSLASGTYVSSVYDTLNLSRLGTLSHSPVSQTAPGTEVILSFRAGDTPVPDDSWTDHASFTFVTNGGTLIPFGNKRYVQYMASLAATEVSTSPVLDDVTVTWTQTATSATLVSSAFDSGITANMIRGLRWQGTFPTATTAQFQLRTAPDAGGVPGAWGPWLGPTGPSDYYTSPTDVQGIHPDHQDGVGDRWFQYRLLLQSSATFNAASVGTVTVTYDFLPAAPTLLSLAADSTEQITASWTDQSVNEDRFVLSTNTVAIPPGGPFTADYSTPTADKPGSGGTGVYVMRGLVPNTAYFARVRAYVDPFADLYSPVSNQLAVFTFANPPANASASTVWPSSLTLTWGGNFNPPGTPYEVSMSTDGFSTSFSTPVPFGASLTATTTIMFGLDPGSTYYFRVRAQNGNVVLTSFSNVVSTATPPGPLAGLAAAAQGVSSVTWTWGSSGPAARYRVYIASTGALLADTTQQSYTRVGLSTNTWASVYVTPYTSSRWGAPSAAVRAYTFAAVPGDPWVANVSSTTLDVSWTHQGNPLTVYYEISMSTDGFATGFSTPVPFTDYLWQQTKSLSSLAPGTTYTLRVRAVNSDMFPTGFSARVTTPTLPGLLSPPAGAALGVSSISWTWINTAGPAVHTYAVYRASDAALLAQTTSPLLVETGRSSNTAYGIRVRPLDATGWGPLGAAATRYTMAATPVNTAIAEVMISSVILRWDYGSNPPWTTYEVHHATPGGPFSLFASVGTTYYAPSPLLGGTTHSFRVRAVNGDGVATAFDVTVSTFVFGSPPMPPSGFTAIPLAGGLLRLDWTISPTTTVVRYSLYWDAGSGAMDYAVLFASVTADTTCYVTGALAAGTTYHFGIRSRDETGYEEANDAVLASAIPLATLSPLSAILRSPPSGASVAGNRVTLAARLLTGSETDVGELRFQYKSSSSLTWLDVAAASARHPNPARAPPFSTHWDVTGLAPGYYDVRVKAADRSGAADASPAAVRLRVEPGDPDVEERLLAPGSLLKRLRVYSGAPVSTVMLDEGSDVVTYLSMSSGAVLSPVTRLRIVTLPPGAPAIPLYYADPRIVREFALESGQTQLADGRTAVVSFSNLDRNGDNRVDGTEVRADNLVVVPYDAAKGLWRRELACSVSPDEGTTLTGRTPHFSFFAALSPAADDLSRVRVYPNPYKPRGTNPDEGKPWTREDPTSGMVFDTLTQEGMVKIYTVAGSLVWQSGPQNTGGLIRWDANNGDSREVASGVYFAVISSPGLKPVVRKVVILR